MTPPGRAPRARPPPPQVLQVLTARAAGVAIEELTPEVRAKLKERTEALKKASTHQKQVERQASQQRREGPASLVSNSRQWLRQLSS
jgi:hypothetical protein